MTAAIQQNIFSSLASHKELSGIAFQSGRFYHIAGDILGRTKWFSEHPSSIDFLEPKAKRYHEIFERAKADASKKNLDALREAHIHFTNAFIIQLETFCPDHSDVVNVKYKKTIRLFKETIQKHFDPASIAEKDKMIFARTPMLAIQELRNNREWDIPEIFDAAEIEALRKDTDRGVLLSKIVKVSKTIQSAIFREVFAKL